MADIKIRDDILQKCNFAYTVFDSFFEDEKSNINSEYVDSMRAHFLFKLLYMAQQGFESDFFVEYLQKYLK